LELYHLHDFACDLPAGYRLLIRRYLGTGRSQYNRVFVSGCAPIITANWEAPDDQQWTVPFGLDIGKLFRVGKLPINTALHGYYNAVKPDYGADWTLRGQIQLMFPKG
jgi:hypothetical protein